MTGIRSLLGAAALALAFGAASALAQTTTTTTPTVKTAPTTTAPATTTTPTTKAPAVKGAKLKQPTTEIGKQCSAEADAAGLHGKPRVKARAACKKRLETEAAKKV